MAADTLLYAGETAVATLSIPDGQMVATSHRLLILTPDADGPNLRVVQRPNVQRLGQGTNGRQFLRPTVVTMGGGVAAIALGSLLTVESMAEAVPTEGPAAGLLGPIGTLLTLVGVLDELLVAAGAISLLLGTAITVVWLLVRTAVVTVRVAGGETIRVPAGSLDGARIERFAAEADFEYDDGLG